MHLKISTKGVDLTDDLHAFVERRLHFTLSRFSDRVGQVSVRLVDVNGPKGGVDKRCRVQVWFQGAGAITVEEMDADLRASIHRVFMRAGRSVARRFDRMNRGRVFSHQRRAAS